MMAQYDLPRDFMNTPDFGKEFFLSVLTAVLLTSLLLVLPAVKHSKTKVVYLLKLSFVTVNMTVLICALCWSDWLCGSVQCLEHVTGYSRKVTKIKLLVHVGLENLSISYTVLPSNVEYRVTLRHAWNGLYFRPALEEYNDKLTNSVPTAPLSVTWILQQFQSNPSLLNYGFALQPTFFAIKTTLWLSMVFLVISWLNFLAGNKTFGSFLTLTAGVLQISTITFFLMISCKTHWKVFIGHQTLLFDYSFLTLWALPLLGLMNVSAGLLLLVTGLLCGTYTLFQPNQVRFISPVSLLNEDVEGKDCNSLDVISHLKYSGASHNGSVSDRVQKRISDFRVEFANNTKNRLTSVFDQDITKYVYFNNTSTSSINN